MNQIEELKRKGWAHVHAWWLARKDNRTFILRLVLVIAGVSLAIGYFVGYAATQGGAGQKGLLKGGRGSSFSWFGLMGQKKTFFPGLQPDGSFVFSNFEKATDIDSWNLISTSMKSTTRYAWEGSSSAQVTYFAGTELAVVTIDDLGRGSKRPSNWSSYGALQFTLFHPGKTKEPLTFLVTDLWGKQYEETLSIPGGRWTQFVISTSKMAASLNIEKINQLSISRRATDKTLDVYIDDIRLVPLTQASVGANTEKMMDYGFLKQRPAWTIKDPQGKLEIVRVPFILRNETSAFCHLCPTQGGIPLPMGELRDLSNHLIRNAQGEEIPFQSRVLAYWPDRSVKWLDVHFEATLAPGEGTGYFLEYGPSVRSLDYTSPLRVSEEGESIQVNTGVLEASFSKKSFFLFDRIALDRNGNASFEPDEMMTSQTALTLLFRDKEFRTDLDNTTYKIEVEEKGTQRVVLKASGWFESEDGDRYCQAIVRYYFYQGKSFVRVSHTFIYTGYPENKQYAAYQMLRLPANETIGAYGIRIPYTFSEKRDEQLLAGVSRGAAVGMDVGDSLTLFQKDYDGAVMERDGSGIPFQDFYAGWMDISNPTGGLTISLRHFRENFPKAYRIDRNKGELFVDLWPKDAGELDLATTPSAVGPESYGRGNAFGLGKTHDLLFYFHTGPAIPANVPHVAGSFLEPLLIRTNPYWVDATGALGRLFPVDPKYATEERMLEKLFDWAARQPHDFKWYGMLNFGDTLTWLRDEDDEQKYDTFDWNPMGRWGWYNCEGVGTHTGALLQFARSGDWKYFEFGENLARHIMDVDTVHYDTIANDKRIKNALDGKYSRVGAMHRHNANHWGDRTDEASHTNVLGLLLYYYLTGEERTLDVAKEVGEYFLTEPFSYIERVDVAPNRAMANALWGDVLLYQATGDERYKKAADRIVKIFLKGQQPDGSFLENYNKILGTWSGEKHELYMAGYVVGALMSYHEMTQDEAVKETFLKLVRYLAPLEYTGPTILHGIAYAYLITRDPFFIAIAETDLKKIISHQQSSNDSRMDGLIYEKPIYHRPMAFLSTVPYIFGALEEHFKEQGQGAGE